MNIEIRKASINDLDKIVAIEELCFPEAEAATRESFRDRLETFKESFFVAENDKEIIGFINGAIIDTETIYDEVYENTKLHNPNGKYQSIFGLDVIKEFRNKGIATKLMNYMIEVSKKYGRKGLVLTCKKELINYYEKFGYINSGVSKSVHGNVVWYDMFLKL